MKADLTLRMDETLIEVAKEEARRRGISVSRLVADYFDLPERLRADEGPDDTDLPPLPAAFVGFSPE